MTRVTITLELDDDIITDEDVYEYLRELMDNKELSYEKQ